MYEHKDIYILSSLLNSVIDNIYMSIVPLYSILGQPPPPPPPDKTPRTKPPDKTPRTKLPRTKPPHPHKTPYKTPRTQTTTAKPSRINPRSPTKHPEDKNLAKSKMAFILNSDGFRALLLI